MLPTEEGRSTSVRCARRASRHSPRSSAMAHLGCEVIDHRQWHPNDHFGLAHCVNELYVRDATLRLPTALDLTQAQETARPRVSRLSTRVASTRASAWAPWPTGAAGPSRTSGSRRGRGRPWTATAGPRSASGPGRARRAGRVRSRRWTPRGAPSTSRSRASVCPRAHQPLLQGAASADVDAADHPRTLCASATSSGSCLGGP